MAIDLAGVLLCLSNLNVALRFFFFPRYIIEVLISQGPHRRF